MSLPWERAMWEEGFVSFLLHSSPLCAFFSSRATNDVCTRGLGCAGVGSVADDTEHQHGARAPVVRAGQWGPILGAARLGLQGGGEVETRGCVWAPTEHMGRMGEAGTAERQPMDG